MSEPTLAEQAATQFAALLGTTYPVGARIPAVRLIRDTCGVTDSTALQALQILRARHLLRVQHGMQSVVLAPPEPGEAPSPEQLVAELRAAHARLGEVLERAIGHGIAEQGVEGP